MLRDVFYFNTKPNAHPRERFAENLEQARLLATTEHFWIINEFCDYRNFDWDFDYEFLPDEDVWAEEHNNVWPSQHQKDSGTWLCPKEYSNVIIYRNDVEPVIRKNEKYSDNWIELDSIDHSKFDFSWHPDPTDPPYIYKWGCKFFPAELKHVLEYRVPGATQEKYMNTIAELVPEYERWVEHQEVDKSRFDMSWRPNPLDPPFIYVWGNKYVDGKSSPTLEYRVPDATDKKYVSELIPIAPNKELFEHLENSYGIDYSWRPDPTSPPYIYAWGNQWNSPEDKVSIQYVVSGATEYKYMTERATRRPCMDNWVIPKDVDTTGFDFSWEPSPAAQPYIYEFATQWQKTGGPQYIVPGATEKQYVDSQKARKLPSLDNWNVPDNIDPNGFDFSWHPDDTEPAYSYVFATQWAFSGGPVYMVEGATEVKYVDVQTATALPNRENWEYDETEIDIDSFDFSWHPYVEDQPYIYEFGTQWQKTGGPKYITPGADRSSPIKYIDTRILKATRLPNKHNSCWVNHYPIKDFDYSWHPDNTEDSYNYVFGNKQYLAEECATVEYRVPGATTVKYISDIIATLDANMDNWVIPDDVIVDDFDFSWIPNPSEPPYIYEFGTQWQKTGGPKYVMAGAWRGTKYVDEQKAVRAASKQNWTVPNYVDETSFDFSWHPDDTEPAYSYVFATQWAFSGGPVYTVPGATESKYVEDQVATAEKDMANWEYDPKLIDIDQFDFSWHPYVEDQPYIYEFGTQHQKTGGPKYITPGADVNSPKKYIDTRIMQAVRLPNKDDPNWKTLYNVKDFDYSWHPDNTEDPYIYVFGNNQFLAEECATVEYHTPEATTIKYIHDIIATLDVDMDKWVIPENVDTTDFDFSWIPNPNEPPYIYEFGTQWQKTGGPKYVMSGAWRGTKYIDSMKVIALPVYDNWKFDPHIDTSKFDFSWHPDATDPPYIYAWGNQWVKAEDRPSIEYTVSRATEYRYMEGNAIRKPCLDNWIVPKDVDVSEFDFSWEPSPKEEPYIYQFGTQWQKTGGPRYVVNGATEIKYIDSKVTKLPSANDPCWVTNYKIKDFDWSWHPDDTDEPYIYVFGNNLYPAEECATVEYRMPNATQTKYISDVIATLDVDMTNWLITQPINEEAFDFSWIPNPKDPPYIYRWGNKYISNKYKATVEYVVPGATDIKYLSDDIEVLPEMERWEIPNNIDTTGFDFTWRPDPLEPDLIWEFGTQWQKTGGPRYVVEGATEVKYVDHQRVTILPVNTDWFIPQHVDVTEFDFSWHPDATEPPYIYQFGTQWALNGGPRYEVLGATEIKYMDEQTAIAMPSKENWEYDETEIDVDSFDFSWHPYVEDQPYVYQFGTQWQKTGGPKYITPGADLDSPVKYIDTRIIKAQRLENAENPCWIRNYPIKDFDWSWHPDDTDEPYIYVFGNNQFLAEECATVEYRIPGATTVKYIPDIIATLDVNMDKWVIPENVDATDFDFSWIPNPSEPAYIYEFGTQWQKTGGPKYAMPGAWRGTKYVDVQTAKILPNTDNWVIPENVDASQFDFSWHPDDTEPAYIYQFGTQWALSGGPRYVVEGATEIKYMDEQTANALPDKTNWVYDETEIDVDSFDFSWHPYVEDQPYVYQFGTQHQKTGGPKYITPGADLDSPVKYIDTRIIKAKRLEDAENTCWVRNYPIKNFDYSWHPDETEEPYIYVFGNNQYLAEECATIEYRIPGATTIKYIPDVVARLDANMDNWVIPDDIDATDFDFSWIPNPTEPAYIYEFGTQWQKTGGPKYVMPGAWRGTKYVDVQTAKRTPDYQHWTVPDYIDKASFDFSWHPDATEEPYIYVFATQWAFSGGPIYTVPGATEIKYVECQTATAMPNKENWEYDSDVIDVDSFDFSWHPYLEDQPYIYQFGTQWWETGGPRYITPGADDNSPIKYIDTRIIKATTLPNNSNWEIPKDVDVTEFDFSWVPHPQDPPYTYQFGTQWQKTDGPRYIAPHNAPVAPPIKYVDTGINKARKLPNKNKFNVLSGATVKNFDWSWHPDDTSPPYIYIFGNNWYSAKEMPTIEYRMEGATEVKFITDVVARLGPNMENWVIPAGVDVSRFDFSWIPHPNVEHPVIYQFGTRADPKDGPSYHTPGATGTVNLPRIEVEYEEQDPCEESIIEEIAIVEEEVVVKQSYDVFFIDKGNKEASQTFEYLKTKFGNKIQKTRYLNSWVDTINRCLNRATSELVWVLNSELDYNDFNFDYQPNPWQMKMVHVFGTQWSHWGTTFMVNRESFPLDTKYIKNIEHLSNLNFVRDIKAKATKCVHDIVVIDHGNKETENVVTMLQSNAPDKTVTVIPYKESYLRTLKEFINRQQVKKDHYIWVCSSVCDYSSFDLSYICDPFARDQLHVFPTGKQKFGDTFFIDVNNAREVISELEQLENFTKVNYNGAIKAERLPEPIIVISDDTHTNSVDKLTDFPYATLITSDNVDIGKVDIEPMNLWSVETKNIYVTSTGATRIVVPKEIKDHVTKELYEYPYIKRAPKLALSKPLDIVFLSNSETGADENYEHLLNVTKGLPNRVVRVDGVNGRAAAYHAAAEASETPWMFTVFAKLKVSPKFDWNWQPDRMQSPKHYIFHAKNPVNGLIYGHQAMIAYNKKLTLANDGKGLDFTLDDEHEVVPLISGTAQYNTDEFSTWRTAFREVIKLRADDSEVSKERLDAWLNKAEGDFAQYSIKGALDADEYYDEVDGDFDKLKLSYEWAWLREKFDEI